MKNLHLLKELLGFIDFALISTIICKKLGGLIVIWQKIDKNRIHFIDKIIFKHPGGYGGPDLSLRPQVWHVFDSLHFHLWLFTSMMKNTKSNGKKIHGLHKKYNFLSILYSSESFCILQVGNYILLFLFK